MRNFAIGAALLLASVTAVSAEPASLAHTITVVGDATMYVDPDHASIDLGVITQAPTVSVALSQNNTKMSSVLAALHGIGIRDNQIQTSTFTISQTNAHLPNGQIDYTRYDGYAVTNKLTVTVTDLSKVGAIIDAGAGAGANSSNSVVFQVQDQAAYLDKVRAAAVRDARH
ncbi:MAG TPA: SIMPL domain-containing protein, partial [Rhizomicrobium sp.]|nr:SIMPL domain-containing protein [Rhizomicrobium sp.]